MLRVRKYLIVTSITASAATAHAQQPTAANAHAFIRDALPQNVLVYKNGDSPSTYITSGAGPTVISAVSSNACVTRISFPTWNLTQTTSSIEVDWSRTVEVNTYPNGMSGLVEIQGGVVLHGYGGASRSIGRVGLETGSPSMAARIKRALEVILASCSRLDRHGF
jgi:hypothetical protein